MHAQSDRFQDCMMEMGWTAFLLALCSCGHAVSPLLVLAVSGDLWLGASPQARGPHACGLCDAGTTLHDRLCHASCTRLRYRLRGGGPKKAPKSGKQAQAKVSAPTPARGIPELPTLPVNVYVMRTSGVVVVAGYHAPGLQAVP
jgi:hypothetical protein